MGLYIHRIAQGAGARLGLLSLIVTILVLCQFSATCGQNLEDAVEIVPCRLGCCAQLFPSSSSKRATCEGGCRFDVLTEFLQLSCLSFPEECNVGRNFSYYGIATYESDVWYCSQTSPTTAILSTSFIPTNAPTVRPSNAPSFPSSAPTSRPTNPPASDGISGLALDDSQLTIIGALSGAMVLGILFLLYKRFDQKTAKPRRPKMYVSPALANSKYGSDAGSVGVATRFGIDSTKIQARVGQLPYFAVLYNFEAESPDELTVRTGDFVTGFKQISDEWWYVKNMITGDEGLVPDNYMEMQNPESSNKFAIAPTNTSSRQPGRSQPSILNTPDIDSDPFNSTRDPFKSVRTNDNSVGVVDPFYSTRGPFNSTSNADVPDDFSDILLNPDTQNGDNRGDDQEEDIAF